MADRVALLRGVNVGGVRLAMADLRSLADRLGWRGGTTYIATGNLMFAAEGAPERLAADLEAAMAAAWTDSVPVLVLSGADLAAALASCPVPDAPGNHLHGIFCWSAPRIDADAYASLRLPSETIVVRGRTVWLHAPEGVGRSALANGLGRVIRGTQWTSRNLNTIRALVDRLDCEADLCYGKTMKNACTRICCICPC